MLVKNWIEKKCFKVISVVAYRPMLKLIKDNFKSVVIQIMKWKLRLAGGSEWGGPLVGCRLKFRYFVGGRLKFSIFVGSRLNFLIFVGCRKISVNK